MADFNIAYPLVADAEGGYQNATQDTGNYNSLEQLVGTNWGINAQVYESFIGRPPSEQDMRDMSQSTAKDIYRANYWERIQGNLINSQPLANIIFDGHVNHGNRGIRLLQEVLALPQDGILGPLTLGLVNGGDEATIYNAYKQRRIDFYNYLVQRTPAFSVFLKGWLKRINDFNDFPVSTTSSDNGTTDNGTVASNSNLSNIGKILFAGSILGGLGFIIFRKKTT